MDKKITISLMNERLPEALTKISKEGGFAFSYNSAIISNSQLVTVYAFERTIREVLDEIFKGTMQFKEKNKYVILKKMAVASKPSQVIITGFVEDAVTGRKIENASVYDTHSVTSVITDEVGFFQLKLAKQSDSIRFSVSKKNYLDTLVKLPAQNLQSLRVLMHSKVVTTPSPADTARIDKTPEIMSMPYESEPNVQNISDTIYRDIQISLLPFVGTNNELSGNTINNYSINILGGYSLGTRQIELGFFFNIDRGDVSWLQISGVGNLVGRDVYGLQAAGLANVSGGEVKAVQMAGFYNGNRGELHGVQVAGFANTNLRAIHGVQVAGFHNLSRGPSRGVQITGGVNLSLGSLRGTQVAGTMNLTTRGMHGSQIAGIANFGTRRVAGSQIAGVFNYGKNVRGTQIGLLNYADSLGGVPIGLISYVNHGYHRLELSADEIFYGNLAFRTGARKFYNILFVGIQPNQIANNNYLWTFGYGIGTARKITPGIQLNIDATVQHVTKPSFTQSLSLLNKLHAGLDFKLARKFWIYGGVTLNGYLSDPTVNDTPFLFTHFKPEIISERNINTTHNLKMWWGAKVALRFL
ncbi:MAG: hypothetical protein ACKOC0_03830 [Cytophagales bacterium]